MFISAKEILSAFLSVVSTFKFRDVIDVLILTYVIYLLLRLIRETRAGQLVKGIIFLVASYFVSDAIGLNVVSYLLKQTLSMGVLAMIILFQPELRRALEKAGRTRFGIRFFGLGQNNDEIKQRWAPAIEAICDSCVELSATCTGALIVVERQVRLGEQIETGTILNATPSKEVFGNIFYPKTPLHDGAVIMRDGIILAAACFLPKPQKETLINKKLGSRHRAAIGMSENSDAVVIVVSEETGQISVALNGNLTRDYTRDKLKNLLEDTLFNDKTEISIGRKKSLSSSSERGKEE
ncbi:MULTISPECIES: diadenylate cyclase CdaA [Ruminococcus]|uniref:Diadenylate cyclase n=1 Tax=Ruminococcus flavefaciens TaxID=1265 RepID=A0A1M7M4F9_RUMFL|nr:MULTISPECIES: diadenylate cyclase CdaA [Ruminococcus]MCR4793949.1 diadenylate cyclase CdaA [Ruminococcus sp.]SHM85129.1 diadenylate cyclase [Ruminococcus flavefaciens]